MKLDVASVQDLMNWWLREGADEVRKDHGHVLQRILDHLGHFSKHHSSNQISLTWWRVDDHIEVSLVG
jgi:hypothetical protein